MTFLDPRLRLYLSTLELLTVVIVSSGHSEQLPAGSGGDRSPDRRGAACRPALGLELAVQLHLAVDVHELRQDLEAVLGDGDVLSDGEAVLAESLLRVREEL